ncbi:MAG: hypothetical protein UU73_C0003G0123 [Candidatus Daviesbacteria bacterium GW2011_GWA1_41_61]|uniref:Uncharacterized protein n=1 Tax=Candidatus Daviesbacteria bacterium GW2011_GWA2_40_9 TaxID=1618424 RepID=A0A0G0U267_9BACT|nr:MAG: hypothetical protein UU26_C0003G0102 [Candidatus Daviesbacteria bacterium GW2011_GWC1_40_9]KKR83179.1 MAG: hypothetical protein UU29_C0007G0049 [Candidatus Daviesbacteria bacterium GW2011_GWA2_40_9]KKR93526.1 MAG: hypothetical protein UU44_C0002G0187 [Candidatus Daviesbacteria bacterium GW2011_GWB1_41_15]KKS14924.1 MAG: hypothetical protein UU73_C0003G0123 [Candidatus Daviesbacteria bacterium GW2011_GWA1_41_61]
MLREAETAASTDAETLDLTAVVPVEPVERSVREPNLVIEEVLKGSKKLITLWSGDHSDHVDVNFPYGDYADRWSDKA